MQGKYRHELKYDISYGEYLIMRPRLKTILKSDPYTDENGRYQIHSIYFDNYHDKALREKIDGVQKREKYRIRWYNNDRTHLTLEKKMKINNMCMKFQQSLTEEQFHMIIDEDFSFLMESNDEIFMEFYHRLTSERLRPVVQVSYVREPYIYDAGNVRITFDSQISSSLAHHDFGYASPFISATDTPEQIVMEVKFDEYLPDVVSNIIQIGSARQNAFSKYGACRRYG